MPMRRPTRFVLAGRSGATAFVVAVPFLADALRQAKLEIWRTKRRSAPFARAGFVLQREWR